MHVAFPFMGTVSAWNATLSQLFLTVFQGDSEVHPHLSTVLKSFLKGALKPPHANSCAGWMHTLCARKWSDMSLQAYSDDSRALSHVLSSPKKEPLKPVEEITPELRVSLKVTYLEEVDLVLESSSLGS